MLKICKFTDLMISPTFFTRGMNYIGEAIMKEGLPIEEMRQDFPEAWMVMDDAGMFQGFCLYNIEYVGGKYRVNIGMLYGTKEALLCLADNMQRNFNVISEYRFDFGETEITAYKTLETLKNVIPCVTGYVNDSTIRARWFSPTNEAMKETYLNRKSK